MNDDTHGHSHQATNEHTHQAPREHPHHHDRDHDHHHHRPGGLRGFLHHLLVPHSHDPADSVDDALEASALGIRAVKLSLAVLGLTAVLQLAVVAISGSVALAADTVHNFSDALTSVPLWIAFVLGRRATTSRFTYGYGRAEDLAGLFIVAMIALSAVVAAYESVTRLVEPRPLEHTGWVLAAGLVGFAGNELVAVYRIRTGRRIGSAALVADGLHARTDGLTSLAVVVGVVGVWLGIPAADPVVGLLISAMIVVLLVGTVRDVGRRLLDGVDPRLVTSAVAALRAHPLTVEDVRMRWVGHRLDVTAVVRAAPTTTLAEFAALSQDAEESLRRALPGLARVVLAPSAAPSGRAGRSVAARAADDPPVA